MSKTPPDEWVIRGKRSGAGGRKVLWSLVGRGQFRMAMKVRCKLEMIAMFVGLVVCFVVIGIVGGISENQRMRDGEPPREPQSRILITKNISRRK